MKKYIIISIFIIYSLFSMYSDVVLPDYNKLLPYYIEEQTAQDTTTDKKTSFSFKIGKIDGDINVFGSWTITLGYGTGFTMYPELALILTYPGMNEGIIFEQKRLFSLDWTTDSGIYLHLFFNDEVDDTEFTFRYTPGKFFNSLYITNKIDEVVINPYRSLRGGKAQDINFGFDWGNRIYRGRFDIQFDSVKTMMDKFKGAKKEVNVKMLASQYERAVYFYLPDTDIVDTFEVFVSDPDGIYFNDSGDLSDDMHYVRYEENIDYIVDYKEGFIKFSHSVYEKQVLVYYKVDVGGTVYEVGNDSCGRNGLQGTTDFARSTHPGYFTKHDGKYYLILNYKDKFSDFEEKNSYKIAGSGSQISHFIADILDDDNVKISGYKKDYDEYTGCIRIRRNLSKGDQYNTYPFYDYVDFTNFYGSFYSPKSWMSKNVIDYSCFIHGEDLKLSNKPILNSLVVYYNSIPLKPGEYNYDYISQSISINFQVAESDIIEVYYLTDEEDAFNLTAVLKNDFRLNEYLIIGDSLWYKMPIKLWEESYYFNSHSIELLYFGHLTGDFHNFLSTSDGKLGFDINAGFSMYYPELKGITIVDDFEYELTGYKLNLHYKDWYPVDIPSTVYSDISSASKGRLYFRNMHRLQIVEGSNFLSFKDSSIPARDSFTNGSRIGPYSSSDGFTYDITDNSFEERENTLSLVTEFDLDADEAISIVFPVSSTEDLINFSKFTGLMMAVKRESLSGDLRIYVDAGSVTERFQQTDSTVQEEVLDEGLRYEMTDSGTYYLYKGESDGILSTNDFDGNGILDTDTSSDITTFTELNTSNNYATLNKKYNNINFTIDDPSKLDKMRGVRITLYSTSGASGILIFNQIRFTESGWQYDETGGSEAAEISPIEDSYLLDHIFSEENPEIDEKLHFQRYKERTLRINLTQNDPFYIEKDFVRPIDINNFRKIDLFMLLQDKCYRKLRITLKDIYGNTMYDEIDMSTFRKDNWRKIEFYFDSFKNYNNSSRLIDYIKIDFLDEINDIGDVVLYLDEICLEDAVPSFGFATKNEFIYSEPSLELMVNNYAVFKAPYLKWEIGFNTENFLKTEMTPLRDYLLNNSVNVQFNFADVDYFIFSSLDFVFKNNLFYNPGEILRLKLSRFADDKLPMFFTIYYDFSKFGIADYEGTLISTNSTQNRNLLLEIGGEVKKYANFRVGYDINTIKKSTAIKNNKIYTDYTLNIKKIYNKVSYSIKNSHESENLDGIFSLDNMGYLFKDDFITFYENGREKSQDFGFNTGFYLANPVYFSNDISVSHKAYTGNLAKLFDFNTTYKNHASISLKTAFKNREGNIFTADFTRLIKNSYNNYVQYNYIIWAEYFKEFKYSIDYILPLTFYPPFSSLYKDNGNSIYHSINFNQLGDTLKFTWNWAHYIKSSLFLPYSFSASFQESIVNTITYYPSYILTFTLMGGGETTNNWFRLFEFKYFISESISFKTTENRYTTETGINLNFYTYKGVDIETSLTFRQIYYDGIYNNKLEHYIILSGYIYKNFFRKNYVTNDKYGVETSFLMEMSSSFHNRLDSITPIQVDSPFKLDFLPKVGYRFNRNFTLNGILKLGYSIDYSQWKNLFVHRFGMELRIEGEITF